MSTSNERVHSVHGTSIPITRSEDHGTISLRSSHIALDMVLRPDTMKRAGWHIVLDDDPQGTGCQTRMHVYGRDKLLEIKALVDSALEEIDGLPHPNTPPIEETPYGLVSG